MIKKVGLFILASALFAGCQQKPEGYVIEGKMDGVSSGKIYLKSFRNKMFFVEDSAEIKDGRKSGSAASLWFAD